MIVYIKASKETKILYKVFNIFKLEKIEDKTIINIPINKNSSMKKIEQNAEKLGKYLNNNNIRSIVLSNELMSIENFKNILYNFSIKILDGSKLSRLLTYNIIKKIYDYKNIRIEAGEITILVNKNDEINIENIVHIAQNAKRLNILTNNPKSFRKVVEYLYNELGILIKLSNNLKTKLTSSSVILNIDFPEETVNQLEIPTNAVIVSIPNSIKIHTKKFAGINIKQWNIEIPEKYKLDEFDNNIMYEADIYSKSIQSSFEQIRNDNIKIKNLLGINGVINRKEFY